MGYEAQYLSHDDIVMCDAVKGETDDPPEGKRRKGMSGYRRGGRRERERDDLLMNKMGLQGPREEEEEEKGFDA